MPDDKSAAIFFFSGTGNTWWASRQIARQLNKIGWNAAYHSIEQIDPAEISPLMDSADVIGFGFPIYGSDAPANFKSFLRTLPVLTPPKPAFGFVTQWLWSGDGCNFLEKSLAEKGFHLRWTVEFNMFNNIALPVVPLPYEPDTEKLAPRLPPLEDQVNDFCMRITNGQPYRMHNRWHNKLSAWIQRGPFRLTHDKWGSYWSVDAEKCTGCERCARICPVGNISMHANLARHNDHCVMCLRCFNFCPDYAVRYLNADNQRLTEKPPFQGPVSEFKPEMLIKK